jgi:hypothetical protein
METLFYLTSVAADFLQVTYKTSNKQYVFGCGTCLLAKVKLPTLNYGKLKLILNAIY